MDTRLSCELLLTNAHVLTMHDQFTVHVPGSIAIDNGRILAVGDIGRPTRRAKLSIATPAAAADMRALCAPAILKFRAPDAASFENSALTIQYLGPRPRIEARLRCLLTTDHARPVQGSVYPDHHSRE